MSAEKLLATVRAASPLVNVIDIKGEITALSEPALSAAYTQATGGHVRSVIFNFTGLEYMNSFGIGMLVMLIIRSQRENRKVFGFGLNDHYRKIFELTRLDQVIPLYESEAIALAAAEPFDLPERES